MRFDGVFGSAEECLDAQVLLDPLIYDAPMHPVYHAKITVSTKNFPRSEGRKNGVKGLDHVKGSRPVAWLDGMVEILVSDNKG
jgi:hypothetical protein